MMRLFYRLHFDCRFPHKGLPNHGRFAGAACWQLTELPRYEAAPLQATALFAKRAGRSFHIQTRFSKSEAAIELHSGIFGANVQTDGPDAFLYQGINDAH